MKKLKILMSAYACEPGKGSEPGVGWRWALETASLGHEVWVITRENNRPGIEAALHELAAQGRVPLLRFVYFDLPERARRWKRGGHGVHLYYLLWQVGAYRLARRLHREEHFEAVHHVTFGVIRHPSLMGGLGIPFINGPLGGGERAPMALRKHFSSAGYVKDGLRDIANGVARFDPLVRRMFASSSLILMKTPESLNWLPAAYRDKATCMLEIGIDGCPDDLPGAPAFIALPAADQPELRLLYVGRFVYLKGMALGLRAVAELQARGLPIHLTMIGQGPEGEEWQQLAETLGLSGSVSWVPWMKQEALLAAYRNFDAFLFPSLHDSSGNVVLESLACGLPVVCLQLGGPARIVDSSCGRVVAVAGLDEAGVVQALAAALEELAADPGLMQRLRAGALARARQFAWRQVVAQVWGEQGLGYQAVLETSSGSLAYEHQ